MELLGRLDEINKKLTTLKAERERLSLIVNGADSIKNELETKVSVLENKLKSIEESKANALKRLDVVIRKLI